MMLFKRTLSVILSCALIVLTSGCASVAAPDAQATAPSMSPAQMTPEQLQQLVAPIALYPDELVAQILAASTYPTEIVEANRWLQQNSNLKGAQLASEVDKQSWDPSVKALTQFPSVLANLDRNLSWTSALGDAYFNDQQAVLASVQAMRKRAQDAGTLKTTPQQNVTTQGQTIIIEPANPQVVYVPEYDPWIVYGAPLAVYPGYIAGPWIAAPFISFGVGFPIGWGFGWGWGWPAWGFNWGGGFVVFNHTRFISRSHSFFHRGAHFRDGHDFRGGHDFGGHFDHRADRGFAAPHVAPGGHPGAFSGFDHGGMANQHSFRGQSSFGGGMHGGGFSGGTHGGFGGGMHGGGGGGMRGGGFHGGAHGGFGGGFHGGGGGHR
jgi:Protein of unknown function (DUF3300)